MKSIKIILTVLMLMSIYQINAQDAENQKKTPEERAKIQLNAINKACQLSNEQYVSVEKIVLNTNQKLAELKTTKPTQRGEKMKQFQEIRNNQTEELKKVLTPEQFKKYEELLEKQKDKLEQRRAGNRFEALEN